MKPPRTTKATLSEQFAGTPLEGVTPPDVHEAEGYIDNVVVCGFVSKNAGRTYPRSTFDRDFRKYENAKVNFDHKPHAQQRDFHDLAGWLSDVHQGPDGRPRARLNVYRGDPAHGNTDPRVSKLFDAARRNPNGFGLSHVVHAQTTRDRNGTEVVESIDSVQSVDIVHTPATNAGLHESARSTPAVKTTLKEYVQAVAPKQPLDNLLRLKRLLREMDDLGGMPMDVPVDDAETADPDDAVDAGFEDALKAAVDKYMDDKDMAGLLATVKKYCKAHQGLFDGDDADDEADAYAEDPVKGESAKARKPATGKAILEAVDACEQAGFRGYDRADLTLVSLAESADRPALAKKLKRASESAAAGEKPTSRAPAPAAEKPPAKLGWVDAN